MAIRDDWVDGDVLYADDLNDNFEDVLNLYGNLFGNFSQVLFNSHLNGLNEFAGGVNNILNLSNVYYKANKIESDGILTNWGDTAYDCQRSTIDSNIWDNTGGAFSQAKVGYNLGNPNYFSLRGFLRTSSSTSASTVANQSNAVKIETGVHFMEYSLFCEPHSALPPSASAILRIKDGSGNTLTLAAYSSGHRADDIPMPRNIFQRLNIDKTTNMYSFTTELDSQTASTPTGLNSGDDWFLELYVASNFSKGAEIMLHQWTYFPASFEKITDFGTTDTINNCFLSVTEKKEGDATISYSVSSDGTNFEPVNLNELHRFTNIGTNLKVKATCTTSDFNIAISPYIAVAYNLGGS